MDQLKVFLKLAAKYRFWIVVGVSALLPMIAYFASSGSIQAETAKEAGDIKSARTDVQQYANVPNPDATEHVNEELARISKDVNKTWRELYARQAPLLTWPPTVGDTFAKWGRKWPGPAVDESQIQTQIGFYIQGYPAYVEDVYKTLNAWDPEEGTGIVVAPPSEELLRPAQFNISSPPTLGQVWSAQERLWLQATLLDVIAKTNKDATDWDAAKVKAITGFEVGSSAPTYRDQQSIAGTEKLKVADELDPAAKKKAAASASGSAVGKQMMPGMPGAPGAGMPGMPGMGGAEDKAATSIYYVDTKNAPYRLYPVYLSVLIEQNAMLDLLAEMEKSPMAIQVRDFEMARPEIRVVKPEKGKDTAIAFGGMGSGLGVMGMSGMPGMPGMGGATGTPMKSAQAMMKAMGGMPGMPGSGGGMPGMPGGGGPLGGKEGHKVERKKKEAEDAEKKGPPPKVEIFDPYYNIVEVKVYGLARIYNPPPPLPPGPASTSTSPTATPAGPAAEPETKPEPSPAPATKAATPAPSPESAPPKPEPARAKSGTPKAVPEPAKSQPEPPKVEPPKAETKPAAPKVAPEKAKAQPEPEKSKAGAPAPKS